MDGVSSCGDSRTLILKGVAYTGSLWLLTTVFWRDRETDRRFPGGCVSIVAQQDRPGMGWSTHKVEGPDDPDPSFCGTMPDYREGPFDVRRFCVRAPNGGTSAHHKR